MCKATRPPSGMRAREPCVGRSERRSRATVGGLRALCKKCAQIPIFIVPVFPHFFPLSALGAQQPCSRREPGVRRLERRARERIGGLRALCKKCAQIPIFTLPVFPHFFPLSALGARGRAEGAEARFRRLERRAGERIGALRPSAKSVADPIFTLLVFPTFPHSPHSALRGRAVPARACQVAARLRVAPRYPFLSLQGS